MTACDTPVHTDPESNSSGRGFTTSTCPTGDRPARTTGSATFPAFKWRELAPHIPQDLDGWTCLDIGCNAGFYTSSWPSAARRCWGSTGRPLPPPGAMGVRAVRA